MRPEHSPQLPARWHHQTRWSLIQRSKPLRRCRQSCNARWPPFLLNSDWSQFTALPLKPNLDWRARWPFQIDFRCWNTLRTSRLKESARSHSGTDFGAKPTRGPKTLRFGLNQRRMDIGSSASIHKATGDGIMDEDLTITRIGWKQRSYVFTSLAIFRTRMSTMIRDNSLARRKTVFILNGSRKPSTSPGNRPGG